LAVVPPEVGADRARGGDAQRLVIGQPTLGGTLRLPRPRARLARDFSWRGIAAPFSISHAIAVAGVLALIVAASVAHFRIGTVEMREPRFATDSIEAWLRYMTVTPALPAPLPSGQSPHISPEGL
jgi:hypothetical protein